MLWFISYELSWNFQLENLLQHVAVYHEEYNIIDVDTINEKMKDHKGKIISDLVFGIFKKITLEDITHSIFLI